jgi:hypothetical protein
MTYVYLIESVHYQGHHYVGITDDLRLRLGHHNEGESPHTRKFKPWNLVTLYCIERYGGVPDQYVAGVADPGGLFLDLRAQRARLHAEDHTKSIDPA